MQLRTARVCLDCEEVHEAQQCPICASESFAFISRWVPAPERRARPRPPASEEADTYRLLLDQDRVQPRTRRLLKGGALGLTLLGLASLVWRRHLDDAGADTPHRGPGPREHS